MDNHDKNQEQNLTIYRNSIGSIAFNKILHTPSGLNLKTATYSPHSKTSNQTSDTTPN
ncbi:hypothetical protein PSCICJ_14430 [Pseudomonas cichorii]|nr:hypothetical protein PSCICJ_14430 [Pseudomonas cichorii]